MKSQAGCDKGKNFISRIKNISKLDPGQCAQDLQSIYSKHGGQLIRRIQNNRYTNRN
jgi:hypothetical protein